MKWLGYGIMILGILLGLYLGIWVLFIGGIVQIVEACKSVPVSATGIALGIFRIISSSFVGTLTGFLVTTCGVFISEKGG